MAASLFTGGNLYSGRQIAGENLKIWDQWGESHGPDLSFALLILHLIRVSRQQLHLPPASRLYCSRKKKTINSDNKPF